MLPFRWQGVYWPAEAGWQAAVSSEGDSSWWYAFAEKDWQYLSTLEDGPSQRYYCSANWKRPPGATHLVRDPVYAVGSFLWAEEKLV